TAGRFVLFPILPDHDVRALSYTYSLAIMLSTRRHFFLGALAAPVLAQKKRPAPERPNIVLIVADDLGDWMLGCYGNKEIRTPNIDRLAATGMRFLNCLFCTPESAPAHATLFTGRTPRQMGG